jgi:hypothetical protein
MTTQNSLNFNLDAADDGKTLLADSSQDEGYRFALKSNYAATTAPTVNDDASDGYEVGSSWINTAADASYICLDPTIGAAVWNQTNGSTSLNGSTGSTDNAILRADGTGGSTLQASSAVIDDNGRVFCGVGSNAGFALGDADNRITQPVGDQISFFTDGTQRCDITTTAVQGTAPGSFSLNLGVSSSAGPAFAFNGDVNTGMSSASADTLDLVTAGAPAISIDANGQVKMPKQPCFLAIQETSATNVTGNATAYTVACGTEIIDQNGDYNNSTYTFTAPVAGAYFFQGTARLTSVGGTRAYAQLLTSNRTYEGGDLNSGAVADGNGQISVTVVAVADMDAGDTAVFRVIVEGTTQTVGVLGVTGQAYTNFSGYLIA